MIIPFQPLVQQDFLNQLEQIMPASWLDGLQSPGPGYEVLQAAAAVFARCSAAVARLDADLYVLSAAEGAFGFGAVKITRSGYLDDVTLKSGSVLSCSATGRAFLLLDDLVYTGGSLTSVPEFGLVRSFVQTYDQNVTGRAITARGEIIPGEVDTLAIPFISTAAGDVFAAGLQFEVENIDGITGAKSPALDLLGYDRGMPRFAGENVTAYRYRLSTLPDTVSPDAMIRACNAVLKPYGATFEYIETFDVKFQTAFDCPLPPYSALMSPYYDVTCFVLDDPRVDTPYRNRCPSDDTYFSCFFIVVHAFPALQNYTITPDDTAVNPAEFFSTGNVGRRATSAYDIPVAFDSAVGLECAIDGEDWKAASVFKSLSQQLDTIRPAGAYVVITTPN